MKLAFNFFIAAIFAAAKASSASAQKYSSREERLEAQKKALDAGKVESIVGGEVLPKGSRPYLISVGWGVQLWCHGSLITPNVVLTSAACSFYDYGFGPEWDPVHWVEFFKYDLFEFQDEDVIRMYLDGDQETGSILIHPDFNVTTGENDYSLLILPRAIEGITPVKLNSNPDLLIPGDHFDVSGWGASDDGGFFYTIDGRPSNTTLKYITNEACVEPNTRYPEDMITSDMMCAVPVIDRQAPCFLDEGSPLVVANPSGGPKDDPPLQVGIVSYIRKDDNSTAACPYPWEEYPGYYFDYPSVYARVSTGYDWIVETVCATTGELCPSSPPSSKSAKTGAKSGKSEDMTGARGPKLNRCVFANPTLVLSDILDEFELDELIGYNEIFSDAVEAWVEGAKPQFIFMLGKLSEEYLTADEICLFAIGLVAQMEQTCDSDDYASAYVNTAANIMHGVSHNEYNTPVDILACPVLDETFGDVFAEYLTKETLEFLS